MEVNAGQITEVAKGISDFGMMAMMAGAFLLLSMGLMISCFAWFRSLINGIIESNKSTMLELLDETKKQNELLNDVSEGLRPETQLRLRNLSGFAFDLAVEEVCRLIKRIREENHIADREATALKIRQQLRNQYEDRKSRFDPFSYHGKRISTFCNPEWIEQVAKVVEGEIYNEQGSNNGRAYTNVKMVYDDIKLDFYHRLNN
jgi:hypothetical protein